jgi:hypothetical protein
LREGRGASELPSRSPRGRRAYRVEISQMPTIAGLVSPLHSVKDMDAAFEIMTYPVVLLVDALSALASMPIGLELIVAAALILMFYAATRDRFLHHKH